MLVSESLLLFLLSGGWHVFIRYQPDRTGHKSRANTERWMCAGQGALNIHCQLLYSPTFSWQRRIYRHLVCFFCLITGIHWQTRSFISNEIKVKYCSDISSDTKILWDDLLSNCVLDCAWPVWGCVLVESSDFPFGNTVCPEEGGRGGEKKHNRWPCRASTLRLLHMSPLNHRHQQSSWINDHRPG